MAGLTCNACHLLFSDSDIHRQHYKTDWHRYNLKREIAGLPHVTAEKFQALVSVSSKNKEKELLFCEVCDPHARKVFKTENAYLSHRQSEKHAEALKAVGKDPEEGSVDYPRKNYFCRVCRKTFGTENAFANHSVSKKHLEQAKSQSQNPPPKPMEEEETGSEVDECEEEEEWEDVEGEPLAVDECLFCSLKSTDLEENVKHMTEVHSFFIPDIEYLVNLEGLIGYLGEKIGVGNVCLWCNDKGRPFYTVKAVQNHMHDKGHCKMLHEGEALAEYADFYDYSSSYPDMEQNPEQEVEETIVDTDDYQLKFPSGSVIGHRSLMVYYKQKIPAEKAVVKSNAALRKVLSQYKALGWTGTTSEAARRHAKDIQFMRKHQM